MKDSYTVAKRDVRRGGGFIFIAAVSDIPAASFQAANPRSEFLLVVVALTRFYRAAAGGGHGE